MPPRGWPRPWGPPRARPGAAGARGAAGGCGGRPAGGRGGAVEELLRTARRRDVLTLLMFANVSEPSVKREVLTRAAGLWPPPSGVTADGILAGDKEQLWIWHGSLDLPPVKSWWRNWRDALPWRAP